MVKTTSTLFLIGSLITTLAGCSGASYSSASSGPANVNGTWMGGTATGTKDVTLHLQQSGTNVTGSGAGAVAFDGPIQGTVNGNTLQLTHQRSGVAAPRPLIVRGDLMHGELDGVPLDLVRLGGPTR
jgi:type IV secretory pathway TrbL component